MNTAQQRVIRTLAHDFGRALGLLRIYDEDSKVISFVPNQYQRQIYRSIANGNRKQLIHKSRQLGSSTGIAAFLFIKALFTPRYRVAVIAHTYPAAKGLAEIYYRFVRHMPSWVTSAMGVEAVEGEVRFAHGGYIRFFTAGSDGARGQNYQAIHASEVAFWADPDRTYASVLSAAKSPNAILFFESTANGPNHWYETWEHAVGFTRHFFSWVTDRTLEGPPSMDDLPTPPYIQAAVDNHQLTVGQTRWYKDRYYTRCRRNIALLRQEEPTTALEAFVLSGDKVFEVYFNNVPSPPVEGEIVYSPPKAYTPYVLGGDPAAGSKTGDFSAIVVLDVSIRLNPAIVYTFYGRLPTLDYADLVDKIAARYKALAIVERNSIGTPILEVLSKKAKGRYPLYADVKVATNAEETITERLGFTSTRSSRSALWGTLTRFMNTPRVANAIPDQRIKYEANKAVYLGGKPQAGSGAHDDILTAYALALMGSSQAPTVESLRREAAYKQKPRTLDEIIRWQSITGKKFNEEADNFFDNNPDSVLDFDDNILGY